MMPGETVVAAVSGGPDSLCLLHVLKDLGVDLIVAHFDHRLRSGSDREAATVQEMAAALGLRCELGQAEGVVDRDRPGIEASARFSRYTFLAQVAARHGLHTIATGHTGDDRVESLLMHLLRGTGVAGLRGMQAKLDVSSILGREVAPVVHIVRPLLGVGRAETEAFCLLHNLHAMRDPSNTDTTFLRNRIRWELIPYLETYNPSVRAALGRTATLLGEEHAWLEQSLRESQRLAQVWSTRTSAGFCLEGLLALPRAVRGALLHECLSGLVEPRSQATFADVEAMIGLCEAGAIRRKSLSGGIEVERIGRLLILTAAGHDDPIPVFPQCGDEHSQEVPIPGRCELAAGWSLVTTTSPPKPGREAWDLVGPLQAERGLRVRRPAAGDRIAAAGYSKPVKVSGLLAAARIPRVARARWPLLAAEGRLLWVVGIRAERTASPDAGGGVWVSLEAPGASESGWRELL